MNDFRIEVTRGALVESAHQVSVAVTDASGRLIASAGDPHLVTYWRSAAKPFQALPLVEDGVLVRYGLGSEELALACASHSSEAVHLAVAERFLAGIGCTEGDLACGPHPPLGTAVAREVGERKTPLTPRWSNCSGKHAGMLALARHHGWPTAGYERAGHPVQDRVVATIARWSGRGSTEIGLGVDGCTAACFALPLTAMARAYAALATSTDAAAVEVRNAFLRHPHLIAGEGRFCTEVMQAFPGQLVAKVGAEGVYSAAYLPAGLGIALKVEDGANRAVAPALLGVLGDLLAHLGAPPFAPAFMARWGRQAIRNTRGEVTGEICVAGHLRFRDGA